MILYFTGTGNSGYEARRIADGLGEPLLCLNDRIKAGGTAPVETGDQLVIVTPTYSWRIPRIVKDWLLHTELTGAKRAWFVMTCGSEIGDADRYNRRLCQAKGLACMGTAQIVMPENFIAMFNAPTVEEARRIVAQAEPFIDRAIAAIRVAAAIVAMTGATTTIPARSVVAAIVAGVAATRPAPAAAVPAVAIIVVAMAIVVAASAAAAPVAPVTAAASASNIRIAR